MNGLLLINVGTPDEPTPQAVRRYLRQFLSDPRVVDIHPIGRSLLLNLFILPFRPKKSAAAYRKVWTSRGSPLLCNSLDLAAAVGDRLGATWLVRIGMAYGSPSIPSAIDDLLAAGCTRLVVLPLYPQNASSSTGAAVQAVCAALAHRQSPPPLCVLEPFYDDPGFLSVLAAHGRDVIAREKPDHVLFSFHGLPERQIRKNDDEQRLQARIPQGSSPAAPHCLASESCCATVTDRNRTCYRAQSFATARLLAQHLGLATDGYSVSFQSRLGRTPWIRPFTDEVLPALLRAGRRRIVVFCPAFVADCLETLEEIAIRAREDFIAAGGESLAIVPAVNADPAWADAVVAMVRRQVGRFGS